MQEVTAPSAGITRLDFDTLTLTPEQSQPEPTSLDYKELYERSNAETATLQALLDATRKGQATSAATGQVRPSVTAAQLRTKLLPYQIARMPDGELASTIGMDAAPTKAEHQKFLGPNAHVEGTRLMHANPLRYRQLKEYGRLRNW